MNVILKIICCICILAIAVYVVAGGVSLKQSDNKNDLPHQAFLLLCPPISGILNRFTSSTSVAHPFPSLTWGVGMSELLPLDEFALDEEWPVQLVVMKYDLHVHCMESKFGSVKIHKTKTHILLQMKSASYWGYLYLSGA